MPFFEAAQSQSPYWDFNVIPTDEETWYTRDPTNLEASIRQFVARRIKEKPSLGPYSDNMISVLTQVENVGLPAGQSARVRIRDSAMQLVQYWIPVPGKPGMILVEEQTPDLERGNGWAEACHLLASRITFIDLPGSGGAMPDSQTDPTAVAYT